MIKIQLDLRSPNFIQAINKYQQIIVQGMQPKNIESVHGFLTPKRILSSLMNPSSKGSKINRSMTSEQINNPDRLDQSLGAETTPKRDKDSYKKKAGPVQFESQKQESANNFILDSQQQSSGNSRIKNKGETDNIDYIRVYDQKNGNSSRVSRNSLNSKKKQNNNEPQPIFNKKEPSETNNADASSSRRFIVPNKRSQIEKLAIQQTMKQLVSLKNSLEEQIGALKFLLDETSSSLTSMDRQFQLFKQKILTFTSKSLDSAFREYKKHLPDWSVYEQVEQRGLNKIAQINQNIEICQSYETLKSVGGKQALERSFPQYRAAIKEIKQARQQCYSQRPIISYEKINKLEGILRQIGEF